MIKTNGQLFISKDFKTLLTRGNKYEDHVLEMMKLSKNIFPHSYEKVEKQNNGEPDFIDITTGEKFDVKLVVSEIQCRELCGNDNPTSFFEEIASQNNNFYNYVVNEENGDLSIEKIVIKQLAKESTREKNIIFLFTFPIGSSFAQSITSYIFPNYLTILFSKIKEFALGRRIFGICPTFDGFYEIRELGKDEPEHIIYGGLDKYYKWEVTGFTK